MKFVILIVAAAVTGALAVIAVPSSLVTAASDQLGQIRLSDLNPLRAIFDYEQHQIQVGTTPDQLGFHSTAVTLTPAPFTLSPPPLKLDLSQAYRGQAQSQIEQSERHMQSMQSYMNNPSQWSSPPPN